MLKKHKKLILTFLLIAIVAVGVFGLSYYSYAEDGTNATPDSSLAREPKTSNYIKTAMAYIAETLLSLGGTILALILKALVMLAGYNNFIKAEVVSMGWVIVRDLSNMFFILILLVIAFATILHQETYQYKKLLPRLLMMAVLINFSKTICGLIIDFAQVAMLTFVNGFAAATSVNITVGLGINKILNAAGKSQIEVSTILGAYLLALIYLIVAIVTVSIMCFTLAYRIVMLWILVILSPLAFLLHAFPGGEGRAKEWWEEFSRTVIVGPVLAFFLWLSLAAMQPVGNLQHPQLQDTLKKGSMTPQEYTGETSVDKVSEADDLSVFTTFIVGIALMWGGLYVANKVGGEVGNWASSTAGKAKGIGVGYAKGSIMGIRKAIKSGTSYVDRKQAKFSGIQLSQIPGGIREGFKARKEKDIKEIRRKALKARNPLYMSMAAPDKFIQEYGGLKGFGKLAKQTYRGVVPGVQSYRQMEKEAGQLEGQNLDLKNRKEEYNNLQNNSEIAGQGADKFSDNQFTINPNDQSSIEKLKNKKEELSKQEVNRPEALAEAAEIDIALKNIGKGNGRISESHYNDWLGKNFEEDKKKAEDNKNEAKTRLNDFKNKNPDVENIDKQIQTNNRKIEELQTKFLPMVPKHLVFDTESKKAEAEALKDIPADADFGELVRALKKALASGDANTSNVLTKKMAQRGDLGLTLKEFGLEDSAKGFNEFLDKKLRPVNGNDEQRTYAVGRDVSNFAIKGGERAFGGIFSTDYSTGKISRNSVKKASSIMASSIAKQNAEMASKNNLSSYFETNNKGQKRLSLLGGSTLATHAKGWSKMIDNRTLPPALLQALKEVSGDLNALAGAGKISQDFVIKVQNTNIGGGEVPPNIDQIEKILS